MDYHLEKLLFSNGFFAKLGDGISISFDKKGLVDCWQLLCRDCAYLEDDKVKVYGSIFRISFHIKYVKYLVEVSHNIFSCGNIDSTDDSYDLFEHAPSLTKDVINDYRNTFNDLETAYHVETRYLRRHRDCKFFFNEDITYTFTGLHLDEVHFIYDTYLKEMEGSRFRTLSVLETFNALL